MRRTAKDAGTNVASPRCAARCLKLLTDKNWLKLADGTLKRVEGKAGDGIALAH